MPESFSSILFPQQNIRYEVENQSKNGVANWIPFCSFSVEN